MTGLDQDLKSALRTFRRSPGFAMVVVATLAIGVGGTTAVYSVIRGVLLSPLPFHDSDQVVMLWGQSPEYERMPLTVGDYRALENEAAVFSSIAGAWSNNALLLDEHRPEQVSVGWVTPEYLALLGITPALGRRLEADDLSSIVISHDLWVRRYGADPDVLGTLVDVGGTRFDVLGVLSPDQDPNLTGFSGRKSEHEVWRLQPRDFIQGDDRSVGWIRTTARLREGVTLVEAQESVDALMDRINATVTDRDGGTDLRMNLIPAREDMVGGVARALWILLGAVAGVLLIAASNVAHLMLGRGEARSGEVAVRAALGGTRLRIVRQLFVEGTVLAVSGGLAGLGVAWIGVDALLGIAPTTLPRLDAVALDGNVFIISLASTAIAAVVFAVGPAIRASKSDLTQALGDRSRTRGSGQQRISRALVIAQVALSLSLVTATGLLLRSLNGLKDVELGFETEGVVTFALESSGWGSTAEEAAAKMSAYLTAIGEVPGVSAAGFTNRIPLGGGLFTGTYRSAEMAAAEADSREASIRYITPEYLATMNAQLVAGRTFRSDDEPDVVLVDQTLSDLLWPGSDPIGQRVETSVIGEDATWASVIGVVAPMKHAGVALPASETLYLPMLARAHQQNFRYATVRVAGAPLAYVEPIRDAVASVDGTSVIARTRTMRDLFDQDVASTRFATTLLSLFGLVAITLAVVGLHGVMAFSVRARTRELGIRLALGAERRAILRHTVASGTTMVAAGIGAGVILSLAVGRVLQSLLFEVAATDVLTLLISVATLATVGFLGAYLPSRLVLGVDPVIALRDE